MAKTNIDISAFLTLDKSNTTKKNKTNIDIEVFKQYAAQDIANNFDSAKASAKKIFETGWNDVTTMQSAVDMWSKLATSAETVGKIDPTFAETAKKYRETANALAQLQGVYKNYDSAEAYKQAIAENEKAVAESKKAIDDIVNFDANKVRAEIDTYEEIYNFAMKNLTVEVPYIPNAPHPVHKYIRDYTKFDNAETLKAHIDKLKASIPQNKKDKELLGYAELIDKSNVIETKDFANKLQNNEYMTEQQRETYNKLYKIDKEKAKKYWNLIQENVNYAKAIKTYEKIDDSDFLKILYSVPANLDRFGTGLVNTFKPNDSYYAPSAVSITGNMARQDLQGTFGGVLYDALGTIAYVAPIIAVSYLSKGVGAKLLASKKASTAVKTFGQILVDNAGAVGRTAMGTSVYGNSYAEMINSGYNVTQAKAYGTLTAISEVLLTDLLSGIAGIGGSKLTANAIKNADSALMQFAIRHGGEAVEEGLQTVLESVFKSAITGEIHEADIGEVLYSTLLGFVSSASLSGVGTGALKTVDATKNVISKIKANANSVNKTKQTNELIEYALKFPEGAVSREIATMMKSGNGAYTIAEYLHDRNWQMNERVVQNLADELIGRGFTVENANVVADAIGKVTNGLKLTEDQQNALNRDTVTASVLLDGTVQRDSHDYGTQAEYQKIVEIPAEETSVQTEQFPIEQQAEQTPNKETIQMTQETAKTDGKIIEGKTISTKDSGTLNKLGKVLNRKIRVVDSLIKNGKQVNGYFNNETGEIVLNAEANNPIQVVLKHELTHSLEKLTSYYDFFNKVTDSKVFKNWLNEQGHTLETLRKETIDTRQTAKDENFADTKSIEELQLAAEQEILADFIGDMLYAKDGGIERMLQDLSAQEKFDFIEWIRDVIHKLINKVKGIDTSFEDELRSLEQKFTKMLNETTKNEKNTGEGVKYKILKDIDGTLFVDVDPAEFNQKDGESVARTIQRIIKDKFNNLINVNGQNIQINKTTNDEFRRSKSANTLMKNPTLVYNNKLKAIVNADEILKVAKNWIGEKINHIRKDDIVEFARGNIMYRVGDNGYVADVLVGTRKNGTAVLYDIVNIYDKKITDASVTMADKNPQRRQNTSVDNKIPQTKQSVNKKLSVTPEKDAEYMSAVENGDMKTAQKMVDKAAKDAGYLRKGYHGSPNRFYIFKRSKIGKTTDPGIYGRGFYFSDQESQAWEYANQNNKKGDVRSFFIKINNPFEIKSDEDYLAFEDIYMGPLAKAEANGEILTEERIGELLEEGTQKLIDMGYDGVIYYGKGQKEYVTFESEQSKLSDAVVYDDQGNVIPLSERFNEKKKDIRWSTSSQSNKKSLPKYTKEQYNNFGWVRHLDIMSYDMLERLTSRIMGINYLGEYGNKTENEEIIIPIGADYGYYNVLVYTNNDANSPKITKVITLVETDEEITKLWEVLLNEKYYSREYIQRKSRAVLKAFPDCYDEYYREDSGDYGEYLQEQERKNGKIGSTNVSKRTFEADRKWSIGTGINTESERDTTGNTQNDVKLSISKDQKREILEMLKNGQITTEEAMQRLDNTKKKPLEELKDITNIKPKNVSTKVKGKPIKNAPLGDRESKFAESLKNSNWFDKEFKREAKNDNFIQTYASVTNKETLLKATAELDEGGQQRVLQWLSTPTDKATLVDEAIGFILLNRAKQRGDVSEQVLIAEKLRDYGTASGRKVQLFSIIGRLTPEGMLMFSERELEKALEVARKERTARWLKEHEGNFTLTDADREFITRRVRQASMLPEGSRAKDILLAEIATRLQNKLPVKKGQGLKAWQRISMLLNAKTNIRNISSNVLSMGQFQLSDLFGAGVDILATKYAQKQGFDAQRTTGFGNIRENVKAFGRGAYNSYDDFRRKINTRGIEQNRYEIGEGVSFDTNTKYKAWNTVAQRFNELDRLTSFLLDFGDRPFYEMWFTNSLNAQMRLNNVSNPTVEMVEIATEEALQRTWQDSNGWTKSVNVIKNALNKANLKLLLPYHVNYGLGDIIIKFTKTPANLAKAIWDFSPAGIVTTIGKDAAEFNQELKKGKYDVKLQKKLVSNLSKAIAGTLIQITITALVSGGILTLTGKNDDDDDVKAFENYIKGMPEYSIKIGDSYVTYEWAQPLGAYLAAVADYMNEKESNPDNDWYENVFSAIYAGGDVLVRQSFLQSVQNLFQSYTDNSELIGNVVSVFFDDPSVYIPQLLSQLAELTDDKRRVTYSQDHFERMINKIKVKIPGLRQTLEAERNVLGEEAENPRNDVFNAFFNPGNVYSKVDNEVVDEVYALYKSTGEKKAILPKADSSVSANGVNYRYSIEEKATVQKVMGQTAVAIIDDAMNLKDYENLTDQQKVEFLTKVYSYSKAKAKSNIVYSYDFLHAIYGDALTQEKYNKFSDKQKKMLADAHFLSPYSEVKEGEEAEYFIKKVEDSTKNKTKSNAKEQKANSKTIDTIIKNK